MIEEDFYATIKLKTGEEIFARVVPTLENNNTLLLINNPVIISEYKSKGIEGYKLEPWLKTTTEDLFVLNLNDVVTISETKDIEMISMHQKYVNKMSFLKDSPRSSKRKVNSNKVSRKMGYICNINDAKKLLEKLYNNS